MGQEDDDEDRGDVYTIIPSFPLRMVVYSSLEILILIDSA